MLLEGSNLFLYREFVHRRISGSYPQGGSVSVQMQEKVLNMKSSENNIEMCVFSAHMC